jgi:hypothetical protein
MAAVKPGISGKTLFKRLQIVSLTCEYTLSFMNFIANNQEHSGINSATN